MKMLQEYEVTFFRLTAYIISTEINCELPEMLHEVAHWLTFVLVKTFLMKDWMRLSSLQQCTPEILHLLKLMAQYLQLLASLPSSAIHTKYKLLVSGKVLISHIVINRPTYYRIVHNPTQGFSNTQKANILCADHNDLPCTSKNLPILLTLLIFSENVFHDLITTVKMQYTV